jgi:hypothetical protein
VGGFSEADYRLRRQRLIVPETKPIDPVLRLGAVRQIRSGAVANKEKVAKHLYCIALLSFSQESRHWNAEELAQKVKQRYFYRRDGMNGHTLVESLQSASAGIPVGKALAHRAENVVVPPDRLPDHQLPRIFQRLPNLLAARYLANASVAGIISKNYHVSCKKRRVRPRKIEQHVVVTRHRDNQHFCDLR